MGRYILRRLLQLIPVFIGTTFIIYSLVWAIPGNPFAGMCGPRGCPPAFIEQMTQEYNLDKPLPVQYVLYLGQLFSGNFGQTFNGIEVSTLIQNAYPVTLKLATIALVFEAVIGIAAGILTALRGKGFVDNLVLAATLFLIAVPVFVSGFIIQVVFGVQLEWIQPSVGSDPTIGQLIAPGLVLGSLSMAYIARLTRTAMFENKRADYIRTATAKGLKPRRVVSVHMLRNSLIPVITFIGTDFGALMGGAIVTEGVFNIHGIGGLVFDAIKTQEGVTVTGVVTLLVVVYLLMNLLVDILYAALDPRIRYD
ncbi:oligopeptide transport system permease protein [Actinopolyspora lacussalsi]|uniref:Oligopeptide transport system permease protein n=1 Tax=Actinopolyspora alba TaxID=673379 RepID=A0A1I1TSF8_9ACTN|nr:ABC transporter permease [Actinopolyspora alba]MDP9642367.1 oligopeptide transport system permease protein [Actinopolyspora lacussalsi]SFD61454.1 oligopeptide transport system permease protein [Actinopolyspora alba]